MDNFYLIDTGPFKKTESWLKGLENETYFNVLDSYGKKGVAALAAATPKDSGLTADSWTYKVVRGPQKSKIVWYNSNLTEQGTPIAILIQYGHGTGSGAYIEGVDFINPAMRPLFDDLTQVVWKAVTKK